VPSYTARLIVSQNYSFWTNLQFSQLELRTKIADEHKIDNSAFSSELTILWTTRPTTTIRLTRYTGTAVVWCDRNKDSKRRWLTYEAVASDVKFSICWDDQHLPRLIPPTNVILHNYTVHALQLHHPLSLTPWPLPLYILESDSAWAIFSLDEGVQYAAWDYRAPNKRSDTSRVYTYRLQRQCNVFILWEISWHNN